MTHWIPGSDQQEALLLTTMMWLAIGAISIGSIARDLSKVVQGK